MTKKKKKKNKLPSVRYLIPNQVQESLEAETHFLEPVVTCQVGRGTSFSFGERAGGGVRQGLRGWYRGIWLVKCLGTLWGTDAVHTLMYGFSQFTAECLANSR